MLIVALALGYFFLGGARTFGVIFFRAHYHLGQAVATAISAVLGIGALLGVLLGGRLANRTLNRGRPNAANPDRRSRLRRGRAAVRAADHPYVAIALPLYVIAAAALTAPSAPLDAAVFDVVPGRLGPGGSDPDGVSHPRDGARPGPVSASSPTYSARRARSFGEGTLGSASGAGARGLEVTFHILLASLAITGVRAPPRPPELRGGHATAIASERGGPQRETESARAVRRSR